jgi:H+/Cl- antiporter ClcA
MDPKEFGSRSGFTVVFGAVAAVFIANAIIYPSYVNKIKNTSGSSVDPPNTLNTINAICAVVTGLVMFAFMWWFYKQRSSFSSMQQPMGSGDTGIELQ